MTTSKPARLVSRRRLAVIVLVGMLVLAFSSTVLAHAEAASLPVLAAQPQQGIITACVYDTEGNPIGGATINGNQPSPGSVWYFVGVTDDSGCVYMPFDDPGYYLIGATPPGEDWTLIWPWSNPILIWAEPYVNIRVDFIFFQFASISGTKFQDLNADGTRDSGEPPLQGVTIYIDDNDNGQFEWWESVSTTSLEGHYGFTITYPWYAAHKVREIVPSGWVCTYPSQCYHEVSVTSGARLVDKDFGNARYGTASGYKWQDYNRNGVRDDLAPRIPEPALNSWPVKLLDMSGNEIQSLDTGPDGSYAFDEVLPGVEHLVCEGSPSGWAQAYPATGSLCPAGFGPFGYRIELASGEINGNNNFGNRRAQNCTFTQGYWKNHTPTSRQPNNSWYDVVGEDASGNPASGPVVEFYDSDRSWLDVLNAPPSGNAYYILAHQFIAAVLNVMNGADPAALGTALTDAAHLLDTYDQFGTPPMPSIPRNSTDRATALSLADLLAHYNEGYIGPGTCAE